MLPGPKLLESFHKSASFSSELIHKQKVFLFFFVNAFACMMIDQAIASPSRSPSVAMMIVSAD